MGLLVQRQDYNTYPTLHHATDKCEPCPGKWSILVYITHAMGNSSKGAVEAWQILITTLYDIPHCLQHDTMVYVLHAEAGSIED